MGVEVVGFEMATSPVAAVNEVDKSSLHEKQNGKLENESIKFGSHGDDPSQVEESNVSNFPKEAVEEWPEPKKIHTFYFVRHRLYNDPKIKAKIDQTDKELERRNHVLFQLNDEMRAKKAERSELSAQLYALVTERRGFKEILDVKKKEMEPLQQALGKLRNTNSGLCSSEEELNDLIQSYQYRIQHESIPLAEEKQLLKEIKQLEGTREKVRAQDAMRAKIQDSMGRKESIQDQVKLMGVDLNGVRKEHQAISGKISHLEEKRRAVDNDLKALEIERNAALEKRNQASNTIKELRKLSDEGNTHFVQSRKVLNKARELAANKNIKDLEELSYAEIEKFLSLWNGNKTFRDDYEKRILPSLDSRQLSRDGRIRNPDEKPLVVLEAPLPPETEVLPKPTVKRPKEDAKHSHQQDVSPAKTVQKEVSNKVADSKSTSEDFDIADKEYTVPSPVVEEVDPAKLKEMKREEELAKAKIAMERKKKLAEKAAAKAAIRAQKEAEKKLKEREKKAKKKAAANMPEETTEAPVEVSEPEKIEENIEVPAPVKNKPEKEKIQKEKSIRYRNRMKGPEAPPRAILKRKRSTNYWVWAVPATLVVLLLVALVYFYLF